MYYSNDLANFFMAFAGILIFIVFIILAFGLVLYILRSLGVMTLAKNRGMPNPWLIWIPVVGIYTVGALADDINAREGQNSIFRWLLLGGSVLSLFLSGASNMAYFYSILSNPYDTSAYYAMGGSGFLGSVVSLALYVIEIIALNKIFKCYKPLSATSWTVLCAIPITSFMQSIFPFVIRNNQPNWTTQPPTGYYPPQGGGYDSNAGQQWQAPPPQGGEWQPPDGQ